MKDSSSKSNDTRKPWPIDNVMTNSDYATLRNVIKTDEGVRLKPYVDTVGKLSIGYGRNLTDNGITADEADVMLDHDLKNAIADLLQRFPVVADLSVARQIVLASMCFNLGIGRLAKFTKMWIAIHGGNFTQASIEMLDSDWAQQVGARAMRLAETMHSGELNRTYVPIWAKDQGA